jgi:hypothetical protein
MLVFSLVSLSNLTVMTLEVFIVVKIHIVTCMNEYRQDLDW